MFKKVMGILAITLLLAACASQNNSSQRTNAEAPTESYQYSDKDIKMEKYLSTLNLGINIDIKDVENQINSQLNGLIFEDNSMTDNNNDLFMCKVWKRENISLSTNANALAYKVPLKVWLKVGYKALGILVEKETEFDFNINLQTVFDISPKWEAQSSSTLLSYDFVSTPKIKLGPIDIPVTNLVKKGLDAQAPKILKALDESIKEKIEIKKYVLQAWNMAAQPQLLSEQYQTWLHVSPQELLLSPFVLSAGHIQTNIGIKAYTQTITGSKPKVTPATTLPDLRKTDKIASDFQVGIMSELSHQQAVQIAQKTVVGQNFEFQNGKYQVKVEDIDIYGTENQLVIKTDLSGSIAGTIYFKGQPYYDPQSRSVKLKNFDYDLKTKNLLAKAASWLMAGKLASTMQQNLEIPFGGQIDQIKAELASYLGGKQLAKGVYLHGKLADITPEQVMLTPTSIYARVMANGHVTLQIKGM
jgi:hypothetical protein